MSRRLLKLLSVAAVLLAAPPACAEKTVPASKVLPFLETYLKLAPADRSRFGPAYYLYIGPQPLTAPVWLVEGGQRTAAPLNAQGRIDRLPTLTQLADGKLVIGVDAETKLSVRLFIEPAIAPAADLDARELAAAIAQAATSERKAAGVLALVAPKFKDVRFVGVASGEVEFADGHRAPLPLVKGVPTYNPSDLPNARRIRLPKIPDRLAIG